MLLVKILTEGKSKESWLQEACLEYEKRLSREIRFSFFFAKDRLQLEKECALDKEAIALDPRGKLFSSEEFSKFLFEGFEKKGSRLSFIIGGAEGLTPVMTSGRILISLSPMTFTHQMTRLLLLEQIYRGWTIHKGIPYHK